MKDSKLKKTVITDMQEITGSEFDAKILTDVYQAMDESRWTAAAGSRLTIWRTMMKSKITQFATTAVIAILVLVGLYHFKSTSNGNGVVLADVLKKVEGIRAITHPEKWIFTRVGEEEPFSLDEEDRLRSNQVLSGDRVEQLPAGGIARPSSWCSNCYARRQRPWH